MIANAERRFWGKVRGGSYADCWEWARSTNADGYGYFYSHGKNIPAHRWAYEHMVAPIPEGLQIDHLCRNRACVNPWHLEPVPQRVNLARGRKVPGARNGHKTHCPQGHPYTPDNLVARADGGRACKKCGRERAREFSRAKRSRH